MVFLLGMSFLLQNSLENILKEKIVLIFPKGFKVTVNYFKELINIKEKNLDQQKSKIQCLLNENSRKKNLKSNS